MIQEFSWVLGLDFGFGLFGFFFAIVLSSAVGP